MKLLKDVLSESILSNLEDNLAEGDELFNLNLKN